MIAALAPALAPLAVTQGDAPATGGAFDAMLASLAPAPVEAPADAAMPIAAVVPMAALAGIATDPRAAPATSDDADDSDAAAESNDARPAETSDDAAQIVPPPLAVVPPAAPQGVAPAAVLRSVASGAATVANVDAPSVRFAAATDTPQPGLPDRFGAAVPTPANAADGAGPLPATLPAKTGAVRGGSPLVAVPERAATDEGPPAAKADDSDPVVADAAVAQAAPAMPAAQTPVAVPVASSSSPLPTAPPASATDRATPTVVAAPVANPSPPVATAAPASVPNGATSTARRADRMATVAGVATPGPQPAPSPIDATMRPTDMTALLATTPIAGGTESAVAAPTDMPIALDASAPDRPAPLPAAPPPAATAPAVAAGSAAVSAALAASPIARSDVAPLRVAGTARVVAVPVPSPDENATSGIDLDAIFPLAGNAPLNVSFVRAPAAPVVPLAMPQTVVAQAGVTVRPAAPDAKPRDTTSDDVAALTATAAPAALATLAAAQPVTTAAAAATGPVAASPEVSVQHHLDVAHDGVWLDRLAKDIAASADSGQRMRFQLNPERLGALHVEIQGGSEAASVRFTAGSEAARALIADAQPRLVEQARAHGMTISDTRVDLSQQGGSGGQGGQGGQSASGFAQQQQQSGGQRAPLFDRPAAAMTRSATAGLADQTPARAERYA